MTFKNDGLTASKADLVFQTKPTEKIEKLLFPIKYILNNFLNQHFYVFLLTPF